MCTLYKQLFNLYFVNFDVNDPVNAIVLQLALGYLINITTDTVKFLQLTYTVH
jgi:hypothetical protein